MTLFRPVIDIHRGQVKQIVGGTLTENPEELKTNFVSDGSAADFARMYRDDGLKGGHVVMLGAAMRRRLYGRWRPTPAACRWEAA